MKAIITSLVLFAIVFQLSGQTIINDSPTNNRAYLRYGIEPTTMLAFGYQRNLDVSILSTRPSIYAEWNSSFFRFGFKNSELKSGAIIPVFQYNNFKMVNNLGFSVGSTTNKSFESTKFAISDEIAIGLYKTKWFIAGTAEYEKIFRNHIEHTDFYRITYYEDARDGWYKGAGGAFQFGIEGGRTFKQRVDLHGEFKIPVTEKFNAYGGSPAHVNLGIGYRF